MISLLIYPIGRACDVANGYVPQRYASEFSPSLPACLPACLPLLHVSCNYLCLIIICVCVCVAIGCVTFIHYRLGGARLRFQNRFPRERPQRAKDRQPTLATRPTRQWRKKSLRASK